MEELEKLMEEDNMIKNLVLPLLSRLDDLEKTTETLSRIVISQHDTIKALAYIALDYEADKIQESYAELHAYLLASNIIKVKE